MRATSLLAFALLGILHPPARSADGGQGLAFSYGDWELACDNTRTCRAAGYQSEIAGDEDEPSAAEPLPVSVLLTRKAGPGTPVLAELQVPNPDGHEPVAKWLGEDVLTMRIGGRPAGTLALGSSRGILPLSEAQTAAMVAAVRGTGRVEWSAGKRVFRLSGSGATATLLKMDEVQGRLGTPGALVRKGDRDEGGVPAPLPVPVVQAAAVPAQDHVKLKGAALRSLRAELAASMKDCSRSEPSGTGPVLDVRRLSATKLLVSASCWVAPYNTGDAYWVVNATAPYSPVLITHGGTYYERGKLEAAMKGRGLGDCWSSEEWTWDGKRFVATRQESTGQCKSIAPGGAWSLPTLVTTVRPAR